MQANKKNTAEETSRENNEYFLNAKYGEEEITLARRVKKGAKKWQENKTIGKRTLA